VRGVFGPKTKEMTEGWRKRRNEELHNLGTSTNVVRMMETEKDCGATHLTSMGGKKN
jgi:hypothetical protein